MVKKYIDAEAAFKVMRDISNHYHETYVSNARAETAEWCLKKLKELPAADVAEVRHGHWIWHDDDYEYECSACHIRFDYDKTYALFDDGCLLATYCPSCGALMDESEDKEL